MPFYKKGEITSLLTSLIRGRSSSSSAPIFSLLERDAAWGDLRRGEGDRKNVSRHYSVEHLVTHRRTNKCNKCNDKVAESTKKALVGTVDQMLLRQRYPIASLGRAAFSGLAFLPATFTVGCASTRVDGRARRLASAYRRKKAMKHYEQSVPTYCYTCKKCRIITKSV